MGKDTKAECADDGLAPCAQLMRVGGKADGW